MVSEMRQQVAAEKLALARQLFEAGESPKDVKKAIYAKFGSNVTASRLYKLHRDIKKIPVRQVRRGKKKKKKTSQKPSAVPSEEATSLDTIDIPVELDARLQASYPSQASPPIQAFCRALIEAMQLEGIESISVRADGRVTLFHLVGREINIGGD